MRKTKVMIAALLLLNALLGACASSSPVDEAYSAGGTFATGTYTRTIFSSSNF